MDKRRANGSLANELARSRIIPVSVRNRACSRQLTVMFCDLWLGSCAATVKDAINCAHEDLAAPEDVHEMMSTG
jgi:hypothetical protein